MSAAVAAADQSRPPGILVIEDERLMRKALEQGLRTRGFAVWAAPDGSEGVDLYRRFLEQIDVVLTDVQMPVLNGPQTLDALREINPLVRCCFMTGDTRLSTLTGLLRRGALRVFTKPFPSVAEVAEELRELANRPQEWLPFVDLRCEGPTPSGGMATRPEAGVGGSRPDQAAQSAGALGWAFSPVVRTLAGFSLLWWGRARKG